MNIKDNEEITIDLYKPDYYHVCENCGQTLVVIAIKDNKVISNFGLCGVCCFGSARMLDVKEWNK